MVKGGAKSQGARQFAVHQGQQDNKKQFVGQAHQASYQKCSFRNDFNRL
jgi:hypothetical protein